MEKWKDVFWLAGVRGICCGIDQGGYHNAMHGIRWTGCDSALKTFMDGGKEGFSHGCERNKGHVANGRVGKTFREVKCMTKCWLFRLVFIHSALATVWSSCGNYKN